MLKEGFANCFMNGDSSKRPVLNLAQSFGELIKHFLMLILLGTPLFVFKQFVKVYQVGIVKKRSIKYLGINIL
jgi:hypothetical protein